MVDAAKLGDWIYLKAQDSQEKRTRQYLRDLRTQKSLENFDPQSIDKLGLKCSDYELKTESSLDKELKRMFSHGCLMFIENAY